MRIISSQQSCMVNQVLRLRRSKLKRYMTTEVIDKNVKNMTELYSSIHGDDWPAIFQSLKQHSKSCALMNIFSPYVNKKTSVSNSSISNVSSCPNYPEIIVPRNQNSHDLHDTYSELISYKNLLICKVHNGSFKPLQSVVNLRNEKLPYYLMDLASLVPVVALDVQPSDLILDMCAAPGGKSLAILSMLSKDGQLIANEFSKSRKKRLHKVLQEYVPGDVLKKIKVTNINGVLLGDSEPGTFDKVLVDAPCSSDRHLIHDNFKSSGWSIKRSRDFAKLQQKLLTSALSAVKVGGVVVYSTCTLSPYENHEVIEEGIKQAKQRSNIGVAVVDLFEEIHRFGDDEFQVSNTTSHGVLILPSRFRNWGPMYTCKLQRVS